MAVRTPSAPEAASDLLIAGATLAHACIADVHYLVTYPAGVMARPLSLPDASFAACCPLGPDVIRVAQVIGPPPDVRSWPALLTAGPHWAIRQQGAQRCLCVGAETAERPGGLVAIWPEDASQATVHCGPERLTQRGEVVEMGYMAGYPVDQLLLIHYLAGRQGLLLHAAGLVAGGRALAFAGVSGAGKTTLSQQFLNSGEARLLSDDRILVRALGEVWRAYGTPWPGEAGIAVNAGAPLAGLLFPAKGAATEILPLSASAALERLLPTTSLLWHEPKLLASQLEACERLLCAIPACELSWALGPEVVAKVLEWLDGL